MRPGKTILILSLVTGLFVSAGAQAFCFMKGNNNNSRMQDYYGQRMPSVGFSPSQYYAWPAGNLPATGWGGYGYPGYTPGSQGMGQFPGVQGWR